MRLIDADALKRAIATMMPSRVEVNFVVDYQPDAIVRCKDCKHRPTDPENKGVGQSLVFPDDVCPCQIGDNWYSWMPKDNWFCADGEEKR